MKRRMYKHQKNALAYTLQVTNPALFMEMRLGKTLVIIRRVNLMNIDDPKILVITTPSAIGAWEDELKLESESFIVLQGTKEKRLQKMMNNSIVKWFLLNSEGLRAIPQISILPWDGVIVDESTIIKNPKAKITKFMLQHFKDVKLKAIMTGTPNPESDLEFATQMIFLNGSFCGCKTYWEFRAKYFEPDSWGYKWKPKPGTNKTLQAELAQTSFILSRKDAGMDCEKIQENRYLEFPKEIRESYNHIENEYAIELEEHNINVSTIWATERYIWLRRLCGGWIGKGLNVWHGKALEIVHLMESELKNEQVVVWFNFNLEIESTVNTLNGCARRLTYKTITRMTDRDTRESYRKEFNKGNIQMLLIQQKIAQTGMNLSGADTAIYYSEPPGLLARKQTEDRILDINKKWPLLYINLLVKDSVDTDTRAANSMKAFKSSLTLSNVLKQKLLDRRSKNV